MKIDDKEFKTYLLDNIFSIKRRFSRLSSVIPDFIYLEQVDKNVNVLESNYKSINLIDVIKKSKITDIENVYKTNEKYFSLSVIDFVSLWSYVKYKALPEITNPDFYYISDFLENHNSKLDYVENNMSYFLKKIKDKMDYINETVPNETDILEKFDKLDSVNATNLEILKIKKQFIYTVNVDSCQFFDSIKLSNDIPFCILKDFYKLFRGFKPLTKWIFLSDEILDKETILLKVSTRKDTPIFNESELLNENISIDKNIEIKKQELKDEVYSNVYISFKSSWDEYLEEKKEKEKRELKEKQQLKLIEIVSEKDDEKSEKQIKRKIKKGQEESEEKQAEREKKREEKRKQEELLKKQEEEENELEKRRIELELEETIKLKKKEYKMYITIEINKDSDMSEKELLDRVLSCFTIPVNLLKDGEEKHIQSEFLIPQQLVDFPIFKDMLFNNLIFKKFLQLDERLSIHKYKRNIYFYFISDYNENKQNYIACSMFQNKVEKTDTKIIAKDPRNLTVGSNYIQLKILRCNNSYLSQNFKEIFSKFISYYNKIKSKVIQEYENILPNFKKLLEDERQIKEQKRQVRQKELLKDVDPEKFIPGYARICEKKFAPKILNEDEIETFFGENARQENIDKQKHIMLYPKTEQGGTQHYYSCLENKKKHLYPGLQRNYLDNFDKYPVVPCCFVSDQSSKLDSPYDLYYGEKNFNFEQLKEYFVEKDESDSASHVIKTQKILSSGRYGILPKDVISFLHSIDPSSQYYRKGSIRSVESVIDVLLYARKNEYEEFSKSDKQKTIKQIKNKMIKLLDDNNIRFLQESYNVNMKQILMEDGYIDPHIFYPLLQHVFDCNIFIFKRDSIHPNGTLSCPNYDKEYLEFEPDTERKYVLIYEHMGTETDNAKYPQCEIIFREENDNIRTAFRHDNFIKNIDNCFTKMYPVKRFKNFNLLFKKYKVKSYGINEFGKTTYIELKNGNKVISILTDPLPVISIDIPQTFVSFSKYDRFNNERDSYEFGLEENIKLNTLVKSGIFYGFQGKIQNFEIYIPTKPIKTRQGVDNKDFFPIIEPKDSQIYINKLDEYNENKNISKLLIEYFYYLFSIDYIIYKPEIVNKDYIDEFIERTVTIKSDKIDYTKILSNNRIFNIDNLKIDNKYHLPIPNKDVLNKLVYNLKLKLNREYLKLLNYSNLQFIPSFYSDVEDFKYSLENNNIIIKGKYPMLQWIKSNKNNYITYDYIQLPRVSVYSELYNILDEIQIDNLLLIVFVSKWSKPSKNIQNKLYSNKTRKLIFDKYKDEMTIVYVDIDTHKALSDYFSIKSLPTFIFAKLDNQNKIVKILSRIEGDVKMYKNIKLLNSEIKKILNVQEEDELSNLLKTVKNDEQFEENFDDILEKSIEEIDLDLSQESDEVSNEEKIDD